MALNDSQEDISYSCCRHSLFKVPGMMWVNEGGTHVQVSGM